jgi:hypothetical protein
MRKTLIITLDDKVTEKYLTEAAKRLEAEINEACVPSGESLRIDICPPFGNFVSRLVGDRWDELGEVSVDLKEQA